MNSYLLIMSTAWGWRIYSNMTVIHSNITVTVHIPVCDIDRTFPLGRSWLVWRRQCGGYCRRRGSCHHGTWMGCSSIWRYSFLLLVPYNPCIRSCAYNRMVWNNLWIRFHNPRRGFGRSVLLLVKGFHCRRCINNWY